MTRDPYIRITSCRAEYDDLPPEPVRRAWRDWFRAHGIDPNDVVVPGWVERWEDERRVAFQSFRRDSDGHAAWVDGRAVCEVHYVQLEAVPLAFPDLAGHWGPRAR